MYITQDGFAKIRATLLELIKRREITLHALQEAKEQGDLSENAGYHIAKSDLRNIDKRLNELQNIIQTHTVPAIHGQAVEFGVYVKVIELTQNKESVFKIVSEHEISFEKEPHVTLLSNKSLVARNLLGKKKDEIIDIETHAGTRSYQILDFSATVLV